MPRYWVGLILLGCWLYGSSSAVNAQDSRRLLVGLDGAYATIEDALAIAQEGDTIEVHGGTYAAPLTIDKSVTITGVGNPIIDGHGVGSLVYIRAAHVVFQGFILQNTGTAQHHEDSGIVIEAPHVTIANNQLQNVLYGIFFANAPYGVATGNTIYGWGEEAGLRGDGIRVWYSHHVQLIENEINHSRDTLIWYSDDLVIRDNHFEGNRYGLHFMYNDGAVIEGNTLQDNSVGAFLMYSKNTTLRENIFAYNRGSSGYGLALKDMDDVQAADNFFVGNREGLYLDNSPALIDVYNYFTGNVFAYNDIGVATLPSVQRNVFQDNSFLDNIQQVSMHGREVLSRNIWSQDGIGNYWSDYAGYDRNGDGYGEIPYHSDRLFEQLADNNPTLRLFTYSPAAQAIEFAASAFPVFRPQPKLVDETPRMALKLPAYLEAKQPTVATPLLLTSLLMLGITGGVVLLTIERRRPFVSKYYAPSAIKEDTMITVTQLSKHYGIHPVLQNISFSIAAGESVALWGTNGAGKTTTLRCLLGVQDFEGQIRVNGIDVQRDSKASRAAIGYVPQQAAFYNMTVRQTLKFYARLRRAPHINLDAALAEVGLADHAKKPIKALSGGMKQRLALAISLLANPPILMMDEPTANLDNQGRADFLALVQRLNQAGKTIIFSSHRVDEVLQLSTRVLVLRDGQIELDDTPTHFAQYLGQQRYLKVWIPSTHWEQAIAALQASGFPTTPNGSALYVDTLQRLHALQVLETAGVPVDNFDIVDHKDKPQ